MPSDDAPFGDGWRYEATVGSEVRGGPSCHVAAAREAAADRWLMVVGDSRGRFVYSALLSLLNQSLPAQGWPTHRVVGPIGPAGCTPHVPRSPPSREEYWGYYDKTCQARYKGPCFDDSRGRRYNGCTLDYTTDARTRLTFLWHSITSPGHLAAIGKRVERLVAAAGRTPDLLLSSTGTWDMIFKAETARCCCDQVAQGLARLNDALRSAVAAPPPEPPLRVLLGFFTCPTCDVQPTCGNWPAPTNVGRLTRKTQACARATAAAAGFAYFDVQRPVNLAPKLLGSPCGNQHAFGLQSEVHASMLLGAFAASRRARAAPREPDRTSAAFWAEWPVQMSLLRARAQDTA